MGKNSVLAEIEQLLNIISVKLGALEQQVEKISRNLKTLQDRFDADPVAACKDRMIEYAKKGEKSYLKVPYCDPRSDKKTTTTCPKA